MKNKRKLIGLFLMGLIVISCSEIFEKDLSKKTISLTAPSDKVLTSYNSILFLWNEVEGVTGYNIKIVTPTFDSVQNIIVDSNVTTTRLQLSLNPGRYQWTVTAYNNSSNTSAQPRTLTIIADTLLENAFIRLLSPASAINKTSVAFKWDLVYNATSYIFELKKTDWTTGVLVESKEVTTNTITVNALENTKYYWGVKAKNSSSESQFYKQILTIDTIPPSSPQLLTPANSQSITGLSVTFSWKDAANAGANARDSLLVYTDTAKTQKILSLLISDSTYSYDFTSKQKYYWQVGTLDEAGNSGTRSALYSFVLK